MRTDIPLLEAEFIVHKLIGTVHQLTLGLDALKNEVVSSKELTEPLAMKLEMIGSLLSTATEEHESLKAQLGVKDE